MTTLIRYLDPSRRLPVAVCASLAIHALVIAGVQAGFGSGAAAAVHSTVLSARLVPAALSGLTSDLQPALQAPAMAVEPAAVSPAARQEAQALPAHASGSGAMPLDLRQARYYYLPSKVEKVPFLTRSIDFAFQDGIPAEEGSVTATVLINERGRVDGVVIEGSSAPGVFESATIAALMQAQFSPGVLLNAPVPTRVLMEVKYRNPGEAPQFLLSSQGS